MKKIPKTMIMEKDSVLHLQTIFHPWQIISVKDDTGIDFFLWPFVGKTEQLPANKQILIQMKSTNKYKKGHGGSISLQIDKVHVEGWKRQELPVLIILDDLVNQKMYYLWVKDIPEKEAKSPVITFFNWWGYNDSQKAKKDVLIGAFPAVAKMLKTELTPEGAMSTIFESDLIMGIDDLSHPSIALMIEDIKRRVRTEDEIARLRELPAHDERHKNEIKFEIVRRYVEVKKYPEAHLELRSIIQNGLGEQILKARILSEMINREDLENLSTLSTITFCYYYQMSRPVSPDEIEIVFNDVHFPTVIDGDNRFIFPNIAFNKRSIKRTGGTLPLEIELWFGVKKHNNFIQGYSIYLPYHAA